MIEKQYLDRLKKLGEEMANRRLVAGAAGNISLKTPEGNIYITARGSQLGRLQDSDIVIVHEDGSIEGEKSPTSEFLLHTEMYKAFADITVVVHTHSVSATAVAVIREPIPPIIDEMTILLGGGLNVAEYAAPGSMELAQNAISSMEDRKAVLLSNHGAVVTAMSDGEAVKLAELCEHASEVFLLAKTAGTVHSISDAAYEKQRGIYLQKRGGGKA